MRSGPIAPRSSEICYGCCGFVKCKNEILLRFMGMRPRRARHAPRAWFLLIPPRPLFSALIFTHVSERYCRMGKPVSLSDGQLRVIMVAARALEPEKRDVYLRRVGALLNLRGQFGDNEVAAAVSQ